MNWQLELYKFVTKVFLTKNYSEKILNVNNFEILFKGNKNEISFFSENEEICCINLSFPNLKFIDKVMLYFLEMHVDSYNEILHTLIKNNFINLSNEVENFVNKKQNEFKSLESSKEISKTLYLICTLDDGKYLNILKSLETKKLSNFSKEEIKSLAYSIFSYWEGNENDEPESIKSIINDKSSDENLKDGYFIIYFDNKLANKKELSKIYQSSVYDREDALNYISEYLEDDYQISRVFSKLPDGCNII